MKCLLSDVHATPTGQVACCIRAGGCRPVDVLRWAIHQDLLDTITDVVGEFGLGDGAPAEGVPHANCTVGFARWRESPQVVGAADGDVEESWRFLIDGQGCYLLGYFDCQPCAVGCECGLKWLRGVVVESTRFPACYRASYGACNIKVLIGKNGKWCIPSLRNAFE